MVKRLRAAMRSRDGVILGGLLLAGIVLIGLGTPTRAPRDAAPDDSVAAMFRSPAPATAAQPATPAGDALPLRLAGGLAVGGALLLVAGTAVRRWSGLRAMGIGPGERIRVVERVALAPRAQMLLVEADGATLLIGATPQQISLIADLTPPAGPTGALEGGIAARAGLRRTAGEAEPGTASA